VSYGVSTDHDVRGGLLSVDDVAVAHESGSTVSPRKWAATVTGCGYQDVFWGNLITVLPGRRSDA
jgi:hypothetical protein